VRPLLFDPSGWDASEHVECVELHLLVVLPGMKGVEVGNAVDAKDDGLAIDDEMFLRVFERGLDDPGIALGPIMPFPGDQPHAITLSMDEKAIPIAFDFVKPVRPGGNLGSPRRDSGLKS
jgi:hypothetical protein